MNFCTGVRLEPSSDRGEFELDRAKSKNNIAENPVALGHETDNKPALPILSVIPRQEAATMTNITCDVIWQTTVFSLISLFHIFIFILLFSNCSESKKTFSADAHVRDV